MPNLKIPIDINNIDKVVHACEYALLGFLFLRALEETAGIPNNRLLIFTVLFCFLYALSDEYHQSFVVGRSCDLNDALADTFGGLIGGLIYLRRKIFLKFISK